MEKVEKNRAGVLPARVAFGGAGGGLPPADLDPLGEGSIPSRSTFNRRGRSQMAKARGRQTVDFRVRIPAPPPNEHEKASPAAWGSSVARFGSTVAPSPRVEPRLHPRTAAGETRASPLASLRLSDDSPDALGRIGQHRPQL